MRVRCYREKCKRAETRTETEIEEDECSTVDKDVYLTAETLGYFERYAYPTCFTAPIFE